MRWAELPADVQSVVEQALTVRQRDAWRLELAGFSVAQISKTVGVSRWVVRDTLDAAHRRLELAGVRQSRSGKFYVREAA